MKTGTTIRNRAARLAVAALALAAASAACRMDLVKARLAPPELGEFVAYRIGFDELSVGNPVPAYPVGTVLRYTLDGSDPGADAAMLGVGVTIAPVTEQATLRVVASLAGFEDSAVATSVAADLVMTLSTPDLDKLVRGYTTIYLMSLFTGYPDGTVIRYTLDGTEPDETSAGVTKDDDSIYANGPVTMKARAYCAGCRASAVASKFFDD